MWALGKAAGLNQETHMRNVKSMACLGLIRGSRKSYRQEATLQIYFELLIIFFLILDILEERGL